MILLQIVNVYDNSVDIYKSHLMLLEMSDRHKDSITVLYTWDGILIKVVDTIWISSVMDYNSMKDVNVERGHAWTLCYLKKIVSDYNSINSVVIWIFNTWTMTIAIQKKLDEEYKYKYLTTEIYI